LTQTANRRPSPRFVPTGVALEALPAGPTVRHQRELWILLNGHARNRLFCFS
jgi:hypothetical protein